MLARCVTGDVESMGDVNDVRSDESNDVERLLLEASLNLLRSDVFVVIRSEGSVDDDSRCVCGMV
jgi:hypothetical protein